MLGIPDHNQDNRFFDSLYCVMAGISYHSAAPSAQAFAPVVQGGGELDLTVETVRFRLVGSPEEGTEASETDWQKSPAAYLMLLNAIKSGFQHALVEMMEQGLIPDDLERYAVVAKNRLDNAEKTRKQGQRPANTLLDNHAYEQLDPNLRSKFSGEYLIYLLSEVHAHSRNKVGVAAIKNDGSSSRPFKQSMSMAGLVVCSDLVLSIFGEFNLGSLPSIREALDYSLRIEERDNRVRRTLARGAFGAADSIISDAAMRSLELGHQSDGCLQDMKRLWPLVKNYISVSYPTSEDTWKQSFADIINVSDGEREVEFHRVIFLGEADKAIFDKIKPDFDSDKPDKWGGLSSWGERTLFYTAMQLASEREVPLRFIDTDEIEWVVLRTILDTQVQRMEKIGIAEIFNQFDLDDSPERTLVKLFSPADAEDKFDPFSQSDAEDKLRPCVEMIRGCSGRVLLQGEPREDLVREILVYLIFPYLEGNHIFSNPAELNEAIEERFLRLPSIQSLREEMLGSANSCDESPGQSLASSSCNSTEDSNSSPGRLSFPDTLLDNPADFFSFLSCLSAFELIQEIKRSGFPHFLVAPFTEDPKVVSIFDLGGEMAGPGQVYLKPELSTVVRERGKQPIDRSANRYVITEDQIIELQPDKAQAITAKKFFERHGRGNNQPDTPAVFKGNLFMEFHTTLVFQVLVEGRRGGEAFVVTVPKEFCTKVIESENGLEKRVTWIVSIGN